MWRNLQQASLQNFFLKSLNSVRKNGQYSYTEYLTFGDYGDIIFSFMEILLQFISIKQNNK